MNCWPPAPPPRRRRAPSRCVRQLARRYQRGREQLDELQQDGGHEAGRARLFARRSVIIEQKSRVETLRAISRDWLGARELQRHFARVRVGAFGAACDGVDLNSVRKTMAERYRVAGLALRNCLYGMNSRAGDAKRCERHAR
jgi:hypothetical protein